MKGIGGNMTALIQKRTTTQNAIGEDVPEWKTVQMITGWLDLAGGGTAYQSYNAKVQESTHVFVTDYVPLAEGVTAEECRMQICGNAYDITLIDNPMEMAFGSQLEFYLKHTGGV